MQVSFEAKLEAGSHVEETVMGRRVVMQANLVNKNGPDFFFGPRPIKVLVIDESKFQVDKS